MAYHRDATEENYRIRVALLGNWLIWRENQAGNWSFYHEDSLRLFTTAHDSDGLEQISALIREHGDNAIQQLLLLWEPDCIVTREEINMMKKHLFHVIPVSCWADVIRQIGG